MSSEQAAGRPIYSSDLYSLGLTAIFLLTGKPPHELETDPRNGEIIWREHAFNLDSELAAVLDRAVRFHPRDRFFSAQDMLIALEQNLMPPEQNPTGVTLNVAPDRGSFTENDQFARNRNNYPAKPKRSSKQRSLLTTVALFLLITTGVAVGTFATGFTVISRLWRSLNTPQQAQVQPPKRQPDLFPPAEEATEPETVEQNEALEDLLRKIAQEAKLAQSQSQAEQTQPVVESKPPKTLAKVDVEPVGEIDIPILTTGISESQLVSTLGEPNSERRGWQSNSKVLVYYDVVPDRVNLSYQSDDTGKIRQTDIDLDQSVSLGAMQQTLARMLGGEAPADIKEKLRRVYNRETNLSFFKANNLEGKVQRDGKDRVSISVWERGFSIDR